MFHFSFLNYHSMLRSSSFFQRFIETPSRDLSYLRFINSSYVKDSSSHYVRVDKTVDVPPVEGSPEDYSLRSLLSAGVQLKPCTSFDSPSLDELSLLNQELNNEIIVSE